MRGLTMPPRTEDFTADPVELFFDLGYVLAFSQLVGLLVHHPDWTGVGQAALLFMLMWLPWSQFTWSANAVSGNGRPVRLLFLIATATTLPMGASVQSAFEGGGLIFAVSMSVVSLLAVALMGLGIERGSATHTAWRRWTATILVLIAVFLTGGFLEGAARIGAWLAVMVVFVLALRQAGQGEWVVRAGHFAERHGLIFIIALGEVVVAIGTPVAGALSEGEGLDGATTLALVGAGVFATLLWWSYFDRPSPALEHIADGLDDAGTTKGRFARDVYTLAHAPMVAGVILVAAALEEIALHPGDHVETPFQLMFVGGLVLVFGGMAGAAWRAARIVALERVLILVGLIATIFLGADLDGAVLLVVIDVLLFAGLYAEHHRIEASRTPVA